MLTESGLPGLHVNQFKHKQRNRLQLMISKSIEKHQWKTLSSKMCSLTNSADSQLDGSRVWRRTLHNVGDAGNPTSLKLEVFNKNTIFIVITRLLKVWISELLSSQQFRKKEAVQEHWKANRPNWSGDRLMNIRNHWKVFTENLSVKKLPQSCRKVAAKLPQSCRKVAARWCLEILGIVHINFKLL